MAGRRTLVALIALLTALPIAPSPAPGETVARLTGRTVISGSETRMTKVRLPRSVEVSSFPFRNETVDLDVSGRIGGIVLKQDVPKGGVELMALSVSGCNGCKGRADLFEAYDPSARGFPKKVTLPADDYWLYVVADSSPVTATLHLPGLGGRSTLRPSGAAEYSLGKAKDIFDSPTTNLKAADARQNVGRSGIALLAIDVKVGRDAVHEIQQCLSRRRMQGPDAFRMDDTCDGSGGSTTSIGSLEERNRTVFVSIDQSGRGRFYNTMSWKISGDIEEADVFGFSLAYPNSTRIGGRSSGYFYHH